VQHDAGVRQRDHPVVAGGGERAVDEVEGDDAGALDVYRSPLVMFSKMPV
jgi:hypothetical protein